MQMLLIDNWGILPKMSMTYFSWYLCWNGDLLCLPWVGGMAAGGCMLEQVQSIPRAKVRLLEESPEAISDGYCSFFSTESLPQMR